jgi:cell division protein FtsN
LWNLTGDNATRKSSRSLLPVLTILFLVSYGLLTMLVVEQGRTIDSQRNLIHLLFSDSVQLSSIKGKAIQKQQTEDQTRAQTQKKSPPVQPTPSDPQAQSPSTHRPHAGAKNQSTSKVGRPLPQKPPKDTSDQADDRRTLISI